MASTYVNDLRLNEMATGDASGTWGTNTNVNLELIGEALGYGTEGITTNADTHTSTIADGATDPVRAMYVKYTGTLDSACTITIAPNTINRMQFIENGTSGSQNIIISQGSGANITIPAGDAKAVYLDGAGSGAAVVDAFASLNVVDLKVQDDLTVTDDLIVNGDIDLEGAIDVNGTANLDVVDIDGAVNMATTALVTGVLTTTAATVFNGGFASNADSTMGTDKKVQFRDAAIYINSSADGQLDLVADTEIQIAATTIDINGAINASGEIIAASLDISGNADIDGVLETDNLTVGGAQGTDGQVLTSTGSGVGWEDAAGGVTFKQAGTNFANSLMVGDDSTGTLSSASGNTGVGIDIFAALTSGTNNTTVGFGTLNDNTTGSGNTAIGHQALDLNTTASDNVAIGIHALGANTTGASNVAVGRDALVNNTEATGNTAVGYASLLANTTGASNVAVGHGALDANTTATANTAVGHDALGANTTGTENTAVGRQAADATTTGSYNVAMGNDALGTSTTGAECTALGYRALFANTSGVKNVSVGSSSLDECTTGDFNTAVGTSALTSVTTSDSNTGVGNSAGQEITTGASNTAVGASASPALTTGAENTCIGSSTAEGLTSGGNNICIGLGAGNSGNPGGLLQTTDNRIVIGNASSANAHIQIDWTVASDKRDKTDVTPLDMGLGFINKLEPVTYKWDKRAKYEEGNTPDGTHKEDWTDVGFLAQDVEEIEAEFGHKINDKTNLTTHMSEDTDSYGLTYAKFVPMLVKAVQELSAKVEELENK